MHKTLLILLTLRLLAFQSQISAQGGFSTSNLPIVVIDANGADIPDDIKIEAKLRIVDNWPGQMNNVAGPYNDYDGLMGIETRGQTSQFFSPKKPFSIELRDAAGADIEEKLLGMPKEGDWVLLSPYSDKSLLRDVLAFEMSRRLTALNYTPRTRLVEVVLNGTYHGVYVLTERIKRDGDRVDIAKIDNADNTGGYIIKIDKGADAPNLYWNSHVPPFGVSGGQLIQFLYHYPKPDLITQAQRTYIQGFMRQMEDALRGSNFMDATVGYQKYIDRNSFIDFMLINEMSKNVDGYRISTFLFKDRDTMGFSKLHAGPAWDFNIGYGNVNYCQGESVSGWSWDFNSICPDDSWVVPFWWQRLRQDSNYLIATQQRWKALRQTTLSDMAVNGIIDSMNALISFGPAARNFQRWPIMGVPQWPNFFVGNSHAEEINYLRNWTIDRLHWMDGAIAAIYVGTYNSAEYFNPKIYPNPVRSGGMLHSEFYLRSGDGVTIEIIDMHGRRVASTDVFTRRNGAMHYDWQLPQLAPGIYTYKVRTAMEEQPAFVGQLMVY